MNLLPHFSISTPPSSCLFCYGHSTQLIWDNKTQVFHQIYSPLENVQHSPGEHCAKRSLLVGLRIVYSDTEAKILNTLILWLQISLRMRRWQTQRMLQFMFPTLVKNPASMAAVRPPACQTVQGQQLIQASGKKKHKFMHVGRTAIPCLGVGGVRAHVAKLILSHTHHTL